MFLRHCLLLGSKIPHFKSKHSQPTETDGRKYTRTSRGIYDVLVMLTKKRVSRSPSFSAVPSGTHPRISGYPPAWVRQQLGLRDGLQSVRNRHEHTTREREENFYLDFPNNVWWMIPGIKLLVTKLYTSSCHTTAHTHAGIFIEQKILVTLRPKKKTIKNGWVASSVNDCRRDSSQLYSKTFLTATHTHTAHTLHTDSFKNMSWNVWLIQAYNKTFKALFIIPTDAHYYKIIEMLKKC